MKLFLRIFVLVFIIDISLGFSISYFVGNSEPNILLKIVDEMISFPVNIWNRLFQDYGIYKATTHVFWLIVFLNAFAQALVIFGILRFFRKRTK